jgi:isoaspartyl peptidase/L-asparaginase-like protein (Ntn-hydrolase superfamily)
MPSSASTNAVAEAMSWAETARHYSKGVGSCPHHFAAIRLDAIAKLRGLRREVAAVAIRANRT